MSSKPPVIHQVARLAIVAQISGLLAIAYILTKWFSGLQFIGAFLITACGYNIGIFLLRKILSRDHKRGIELSKKSRFAEAAPYFEASYRHFQQHPAIDRYRWLLLGSASSMSYREMALCNAAFCYSQAGDGNKATALYGQALAEFPNSSMAASSLKMLQAGRQMDSATLSGALEGSP